jgi:hypothetical protein
MSEGNGYCSLEELTRVRKPREMDLDVPGVGKVRLRGFGVRQRSRFENSVQGKNREEIRERLLVATIIKPEGLTAAHLRILGDSDAATLEPIVEAAMEITGLSAQDVDALEKKDDGSSETTG